MRAHDLKGQRFNMLLVLDRVPAQGATRWKCRCDCGKYIEVDGSRLVRKRRDCGCQHSVRLAKRNYKHGHAITGKITTTFVAWSHMLDRCTNPRSDKFHHYGGRGITVCDRWLGSFNNFLKDMGEKPPGLTLERNNVNGHYEPSNCRWATWKEQQNNRRNNRKKD